ncbi:MAG TPA: uroporphyrinogen decarboxylase family protein [Armatimonadota bacterium]|jgi:hypothetical protein
MSAVTVSLNFMPAFYHKHTGVTYGEAYYFDPEYRAQVECIEAAFLHEALGRYGVGSAQPQPSPTLVIQPIDLIKLTQGAKLHCPPDATLETWGHPWAALTLDEIARLDPQDAAQHPVIDRLLRQYRDMTRRYGDDADLLGLKSGLMNIHAPFTAAHQLYGEELFFLMADEPEAAQRLFGKIWEIYRAIFARLTAELGVPAPTRLQLGDCSASLLSPATYRTVVLPTNQTLAAGFATAGYHSCGASTHLLPEFAKIAHVVAIELGPGTDLAAAVAQLPRVAMRPLIDPLVMRDGAPEQVETLIRDTLHATAPAPATTLCAWSFDRETPLGNVEALYQTVAACG